MSRKRKTKNLSITVFSVASLLLLPVSPAQSRALEEVVVTATKREAGLQDVPIAITALSGELLEEKGLVSATDLEKFTPGLRIPQQDASKTFVRIRGVGSRKFDIGAEGSVGIFVDEIYLPRFSGADLGFLDVERVEVLKGPQGTILGRNTAAGAISVTNRRPTDETEAYIEAGFGNEESYLLRGAIAGPVSDTLKLRLALGTVEDGGMQENTLTGTTDDRTTSAARFQAQWDPDDDWSVLGGLHVSKREQAALLQKNTPIDPQGTILPLFGTPGVTYTVTDDLRRYPSTEDGKFTGESFMANLRVERFFEDFSVTSVTGYVDTDDDVFEDFDAGPADIGTTRSLTTSETFSQEFRITGSQYLVGLYLYNDEAFTDGRFNWLTDSLQNFISGEPVVGDIGLVDIETESWAVFGEYTFDLSDTFSLTVGGRYSYDEKTFTFDADTTLIGLPGVLVPFVYSGNEDWNSFDPKIALNYTPNEDWLVYLTYSEGYKSGGIQFTAINIELAQQLFDPEELSAYEVGFKADLLDKTLRLNGSAFFYEYDDLQVQRVETAITGGLPVAFTDNAAQSDIYGAEIEALWLLPGGFSTRFAYAYLDATYGEYFGAADEDFSGNPLPVSPEHTLMVTLDYRHALDNGWEILAATDWTWVDDHNFDVDDNDVDTKQADYALGAANLALTSPDGKWTLSAFVQNLLDEDYYAQRTRRESEIIATAADGRRYGVRLKFTF